jgi:hypothetical protein
MLRDKHTGWDNFFAFFLMTKRPGTHTFEKKRDILPSKRTTSGQWWL